MIAEVEAKIRAAVVDAKAKGWRIIRGNYWDPRIRGCCVLGACIVDQIEEASMKAEVPLRAADFLGVRIGLCHDIAIGFDGDAEWAEAWDGYRLGQKLRDLVDP